MVPRRSVPQRSAAVRGMALTAALAVVLVDELADGAKGAALPGIAHDLALSYGQIGLLASVPVLAGGILELPVGLMAGGGHRRRWAILVGGAVFVAALGAAATARSFVSLLAAFVMFFPASGAFVSLTEAALMDADPGRREQRMAQWNLAGSTGSVAGSLLLAALLAAGGTWREGYLALAGCAAAVWLGMIASPTHRFAGHAEGPAPSSRATVVPAALRVACGSGAVRWATLLPVSDLLVDVLTGFVALYLVGVVHATPAQAALAVAVRLAAGLVGDAVLLSVAGRVDGNALLRASAGTAALLYPAFLLVPGLAAKLVILAVLSAVTAPWYPMMQAGLYRSLPGHSGVAVSLSSAAGLVGGLGPLAVGFLAEHIGLGWSLGCLTLAPITVLTLAGRRRHAEGPGAAPAADSAQE